VSEMATEGDTADLGNHVEVRTFSESSLPLVVRPASDEYRSLDALLDWGRDHFDALDRALVAHGAVLLRGFEVPDTAAFERVSDLFPPYELGYQGGATARAKIAGRVYEATHVPPEVWIMLHQEMAYMRTFPSKLAFYCHVSPVEGGETTIGDMRTFTAALPTRLLDDLAHRGVRYQRNFISPDTIDGRTNPVFNHMNWVEAFYTDDPRQVEADCAERGLEYEWQPDGSITTWNVLPGVAVHPIAGDTVYFSQLHTQRPHPRRMGNDAWSAYSQVYREGAHHPYNACFGDGTPLAEKDMMAIYVALDDVTVSFRWQHGDVMFVDNLHTGHGRNPYVGHRDVQVALIA